MQVWSPHGDSLLSPDDVEKAVREGIENIPVTDHVMEDEDIILRDDPDDSQDDNEDLAAGDSVNSPRLDNNVAVTSDEGQQAFQSEKLADDSDSDDDSDDMTDQSDEGLSYRELLIITLSSSVLIILIILISVLSLLHRRHRDKCLHSLGHPDLIPGPGSGSGAASVSGTVLTPHNQQSNSFSVEYPGQWTTQT